MKRLISLILISTALLSQSGCSSIYTNYREIQQLMVVQTMGLDREEGSVVVSMAAAAEASGSGPRHMSAKGGTVSTAIDRAYDLSYEEEIFFSHVNHILIGESAAEEDMDSFLDYLCQSPELRIDIPLYVVREDTANRAVTEVGDGSRGISEVMQAVRESFATSTNSRVFTVADTISSMERYGSALVCAIRCESSSEISDTGGESESGQTGGGDETEAKEKQEAAQEQETNATEGKGEAGSEDETAATPDNSEEKGPLMAGPAGYAVIRDGRLCEYIEPEQAVAVGLMMDSVPVSFIPVLDTDGRPCSLEVYGGSARLSPIWGGPGELTGLEIDAQVQASVMESGSADESEMEEYINFLTGQLESAVSSQLNSLLQSSMELKADFLGLAGRVERSSPENFRLMAEDFDQVLPSLQLQIKVSGQLNHTNDMKEG